MNTRNRRMQAGTRIYAFIFLAVILSGCQYMYRLPEPRNPATLNQGPYKHP